MATEDLVMLIDKPHFTVKLHKNVLEVDLKEGLKRELEDIAEKNPSYKTLRATLGFLLQNVIPLDVPLKDIHSAGLDGQGQVKIKIPHRRDITIPLEQKESKKLVDKLKELIPIEKQKELERLLISQDAKKQLARERVASRIGEADVLGRDRD